MEKENAFQNAPLEISERNYINRSSDYFQTLTRILHSELKTTNPLSYCPIHHAIMQ